MGGKSTKFPFSIVHIVSGHLFSSSYQQFSLVLKTALPVAPFVGHFYPSFAFWYLVQPLGISRDGDTQLGMFSENYMYFG